MIKKEIAKDKSLEELLVLADELARGYFRQGLNCTECVLRAVMDIYETDTPASFDLVFMRESLFADGAEYLAYDAEQDGWYISGPIESADKAVEILRAAGALG